MSIEATLIAGVVSIIIWSAVSWELTKSSKEQNGKLITLLMSAGCLATMILMIQLFETITF
ncbi:hypothetical protein [Oceanobacillus jeddahense]|uniref:hypothetical protein n=1 Tax=Oceanobacillus jeddahense TaxID=1462527 RepID=UPI00059587C4|nr:hypothetical protein [Oceanobacillus jeddahense]